MENIPSPSLDARGILLLQDYINISEVMTRAAHWIKLHNVAAQAKARQLLLKNDDMEGYEEELHKQ